MDWQHPRAYSIGTTNPVRQQGFGQYKSYRSQSAHKKEFRLEAIHDSVETSPDPAVVREYLGLTDLSNPSSRRPAPSRVPGLGARASVLVSTQLFPRRSL